MAKTSTTTTSSSTSSWENSVSQSVSDSITKALLDSGLRDEIMAGLAPGMTDDEIKAYADSLLRPILNAGLEESQHNYETTRLSKEQEIENISANLARAIQNQNDAYRKNMTDIETAALARGMGRSSYTLQTLANQGDALAKAVNELTGESARQNQQIQQQISLAAQQNAATQGRLGTDYASNLAAKVQELRSQRDQTYNQNYLTATSAAMGQQTHGNQQGTSSSTGGSTSESISVTTSGSSGSGSSSKKASTGDIDAIDY